MAIAKVLRADIVCGAGESAALLDLLEGSGLVEVVDAHAELPPEAAEVEVRPSVDLSACDSVLSRTRAMLEAYQRFLPVRKGMLQGFFGSPPYVTETEFHRIYEGFSLDEAAASLESAVREHDELAESAAAREQLLALLAPWESLGIALEELSGLAWARLFPVRVLRRQQEPLSTRIAELGLSADTTWTEVSGDEKQAWGIFASVAEARERLEQLLREAGVELVELPASGGTPRQLMGSAAAGLAATRGRIAAIEERLAGEAATMRPVVQAVSDEYSGRRRDLLVQNSLYHSGHAAAVTGWILERDRPMLEGLLAERMPSVQAYLRPPVKAENPPVKLDNPRILKPFQMLLDMFGLPPYFGFDPTPMVAAAMTLFYAMCLGDVGYGAVQAVLAWLLLRKYKPAEGSRMFLTLLLELGIAAVVFGLLTWSFFGLSPGYTAGGPKILGFLPLFQPTSDFLLVIGIAIAIGVLYQLLSILAGLYGAVIVGDLKAAIFDYGAWFLLLVSILLWVGGKLLPGLPKAVGTAGMIGVAASVLVIIGFAGRDAKTFIGRIFTGIISLYGIVGAYGLVSFFSDALSYCRLAILNLTGGFIAMVGNLLGGLIISTDGIVAAIFTVIIGTVIIVFFHVLNLVLSMQGSFIHSLRLNYLESFGRFYKTGGKPFRPLRKEGQFYRFEQ
jgi:V/A-type H+-transporting ATPase subunit I